MSSQWLSQILLQGLVSHELTAYLSIFNAFKLSELWPYYQKHVNQTILNSVTLKLCFTNIWGFCSNFVDYESCPELNSPGILGQCETNLDDSTDSGSFSVRGYLPLIRKDSSTHRYGLTVFVKKGLPFALELSLEDSAKSYLCFRLSLLHSVSYFFFLYQSPFSSFWTVFDSIWSNIDEVLSIY